MRSVLELRNIAESPGKMIQVLSLLCFILFLIRLNPALTELEVTLNDTVVLVGASTCLLCSGPNITWKHMENDDIIYMNKSIYPKFEIKGYHVKSEENGTETHLCIDNVTVDHAGNYECDKFTAKEKHSTKLIVLEDLPKCSVNMDEFICDIPTDKILLSCSVMYHRNTDPVDLHVDLLEWRNNHNVLNLTCPTVKKEPGNLVWCNATVILDSYMNGSVFTCQTKGRASEEQYNCTTKPIQILSLLSSDESQPMSVFINDKVDCGVTSNWPCTYKWVWYKKVGNDESRTIESTDHVLSPTKIGLHRCEAQCTLRNQTCQVVFPKYVNVSDFQSGMVEKQLADTSAVKNEGNDHWMPAIVCLLVLQTLHFVIFGLYLLSRLRRKKDRVPATVYYDRQVEVHV